MKLVGQAIILSIMVVTFPQLCIFMYSEMIFSSKDFLTWCSVGEVCSQACVLFFNSVYYAEGM